MLTQPQPQKAEVAISASVQLSLTAVQWGAVRLQQRRKKRPDFRALVSFEPDANGDVMMVSMGAEGNPGRNIQTIAESVYVGL